jgi:hypothetical protein
MRIGTRLQRRRTILCGLAAAALTSAVAAQGVRLLPGPRVETHGKGASSVATVDLDQDGVLDLVATDGDPQKGFRVFLGQGDGTFDTGVAYDGPPNWNFDFADFTGDGVLDLVTGDFNPDPPLGVWVYPGLGDGSLGPPSTTLVGSNNIWQLAPGDFDADGRMDLALIAGSGAQAVRVGLGNGDGTFQLFSSIGFVGLSTALEAADFDADGRLDLIEGAQLSVHLGNGDGTFKNPITNGASGTRLCVADLDADGLPDTVSHSSSTLRVHRGQGDGTLVEVAQYSTSGTLEEDMRLADVDGDGLLDLLSTRIEGFGVGGQLPGLEVRLGLPGPAFAPPTFYGTGGEPWGMAVGDFDGDGAIDAALGQASQDSDTASSDIGLAFGRGDGSFDVPDILDLSVHARATELADMNGDGHLDLVATVSVVVGLPAVRVALGHGDGSFDSPVAVDVGTDAGELAVADLDGDGVLDLVVAGDPPFEVTIAALGAGDGVTFGPAQVVATGNVVEVLAGQLDDDAVPDIAVARSDTGVVTIYHGDGRGGFGAGQYLSAGGFPNAMLLEDLDSDGRTDIACADSGSVVGVLRNLGGGLFADPQTFAAPGNPLRIAAGDFDRDGLMDLATSHKQPKQVQVFLGTGGGGFAPSVTTSLGQVSRWLAAADVNRDGVLDLVGVHGAEKAFLFDPDQDEQPGLVSLLLGRGDGTFLPRRLFFAGENPLDGALGDVDEDGLLDVAATSFQGQAVWLLRNLTGPWENLGFALAASAGTPQLSGSGVPSGVEPVELLATGLPSGLPGLLFVGLEALVQPFKGGTLVPLPTLAIPIVAQGLLHGRWSPAIPPGTPVYFQAWFVTPPGGEVAATNALLTIGE